MNVSPAIVGIGALVGGGAAVGVGSTMLMDSIAGEHPTGSDADRPAGRVAGGAALLGFAVAAGGVVALAKGRLKLGAALLGGGFGTMAGSLGASVAFGVRHGVGVKTTVDNVLRDYDHNRNDQLELTDQGWFQPAETTRVETDSHEDSDGDTHYDTTYYSIDRLATRADLNHDQIATRDELTTAVSAYDLKGDGRLDYEEMKRFDREIGERVIG